MRSKRLKTLGRLQGDMAAGEDSAFGSRFLLTPKPKLFSMFLLSQDILKSSHLCLISSSTKSKFVHNRKAKTTTQCQYVIHLIKAKAPKRQPSTP